MSKRKTTPNQPPAPESLTYEQAVAELESIIDRMESGETPLEEALADYERGVSLLRRCREIISVAEQKIEFLKTAAGAGELSAAAAGESGEIGESREHEEEDDSTR